MLDPGERIRRMKEPVQVRWTAERTERVLGGLRRSCGRSAALVLLGAAAALGILWMVRSHVPTPSPTEVGLGTAAAPGAGAKSGAIPELLRLQDGSTIRRLDPNSLIEIAQDGPTASVIHLRQGRAAFDVVPRPGRLFRVEAGTATIEVLGTAFTVSRQDDQVDVQVERGRVRVLWPGGQLQLTAGQVGRFPPLSPPALAPAGAGGSDPVPTVPAERRAPPDHAGYLLAAADAARLSGRREQALTALRRFQKEYSSDGRVALATFTEGRLLLELGQARAAAYAFRRLQERQPHGPLHEDALAREVQAWDQAGEPAEARRCAEQYLLRYVQGSRRALVKRHGHLPPPP